MLSLSTSCTNFTEDNQTQRADHVSTKDISGLQKCVPLKRNTHTAFHLNVIIEHNSYNTNHTERENSPFVYFGSYPGSYSLLYYISPIHILSLPGRRQRGDYIFALCVCS